MTPGKVEAQLILPGGKRERKAPLEAGALHEKGAGLAAGPGDVREGRFGTV